jgi:4-hydroxybenzoate polyprenyltransferase
MKFKAFLELGRISNLPTCLSNATAGFYLGGGDLVSHPVQWSAAVVATLCFYEGGLFLNDIFDFSTDLRERPERPIPSGRVLLNEARWGVVVFFLIGWLCVLLAFPHAFWIALVLNALVIQYNWVHSVFSLSPLLMGGCRACVYWLAAAAAVEFAGHTGSLIAGSVILLGYIAAVSLVARDELSSQVLFRQKLGSALVLLMMVLAVLLSGSHLGFFENSSLELRLTWIFCSGFAVIWIGAAVSRLFRSQMTPRAAVGRFLAGMSLLDTVLLSSLGEPWLVVLGVGCFTGTLVSHRWIRGT